VTSAVASVAAKPNESVVGVDAIPASASAIVQYWTASPTA
jgi:hypothetical protein